MSFEFDPSTCDLCGSQEYSVLADLTTDRAMCSDRRLIEVSLKKWVCNSCGLVRSGTVFGSLEDYYTEDYTLNVQPDDHFFYTNQGRISRSALICDWFISSMGAYRWQGVSRCLEVGAGSGLLLQEFMGRFPEVKFEGIELNKAATALAQRRGLPVYQNRLDDLEGGQYDLIYALGVLEHVSSPTLFLEQLRKLLTPGGLLFLCQPTQDVPSYDILFADHLHHFATDHIRQYARKCGFREVGFVAGHEWIPNFSIHLWQVINHDDDFIWAGPPAYTASAATVSSVLADMQCLDSVLDGLVARQRHIAVFGLNEVYWLTRAYSLLGEVSILCGLDDVQDRPEYSRLNFPVVAPEDALKLGVDDVLMTINKVYYDQVRQRLEHLGLVVHPVLS